MATSHDAGGAGGRGRLFVVATPIGNLADISPRALEVLRSVDLIAAEDTRHTRRLLDRYEIAGRSVSYHARNADVRGPELLARLETGESVALVTDAGTPGVSDPGADLVREWGARGGVVVPIPGASAVLAAVSATGIAGPRWSFEGFLPRSGRERRERLARIAGDERGAVLFEAPGRLDATLRDLASACGGARTAAVCRELTKLHEEIIRGSLAALAASAAAGQIDRRGELVIVLGERREAASDDPVPASGESSALSAALAEVDRLIGSGVARGEAARRVSEASGIPRRSLYAAPTRVDPPSI
jgi:16S rRNA (cytidine1402-2'-O)-methyltransferase